MKISFLTIITWIGLIMMAEACDKKKYDQCTRAARMGCAGVSAAIVSCARVSLLTTASEASCRNGKLFKGQGDCKKAVTSA
ncbi:unnamed protein product [Clonostachys rosea]|uniref:Extracellular membrane protein CFEM domain-containing protein n=1 Tax=Bionectria ochroleuca TaxID=29856 RepID=A0ABY6U0U8_BIOOC|nr:unnamed protein product [Clonostachys rosea]